MRGLRRSTFVREIEHSGTHGTTTVGRTGAKGVVIGLALTVASALAVLAASAGGAQAAREDAPSMTVAREPNVAEPAAAAKAPAAPTCPAGSAPLLRIERHANATAGGAPTPQAALSMIAPSQQAAAAPFSARPGAPVWFTLGDQTFVATSLLDGTWFASRATFVACKTHADISAGR